MKTFQHVSVTHILISSPKKVLLFPAFLALVIVFAGNDKRRKWDFLGSLVKCSVSRRCNRVSFSGSRKEEQGQQGSKHFRVFSEA